MLGKCLAGAGHNCPDDIVDGKYKYKHNAYSTLEEAKFVSVNGGIKLWLV